MLRDRINDKPQFITYYYSIKLLLPQADTINLEVQSL